METVDQKAFEHWFDTVDANHASDLYGAFAAGANHVRAMAREWYEAREAFNNSEEQSSTEAKRWDDAEAALVAWITDCGDTRHPAETTPPQGITEGATA